STLSRYCNMVNQFLLFCDSKDIPIASHMPASEHLLCTFTTSHVGLLVIDTVRNHLSVLKGWHIYN
ncbi:hypothetical protein PAXRUDRAFT_44836, partial [Paxillus rubicundulus Ve08.2h10]